jgi:excisionase family DNA binding protein
VDETLGRFPFEGSKPYKSNDTMQGTACQVSLQFIPKHVIHRRSRALQTSKIEAVTFGLSLTKCYTCMDDTTPAKELSMADETLFTVDEVAKRLAVHPDTVRNWIKSGELDAFDLGGRAGYRISQAQLDEFLRKRLGSRKD